MSSCLFHSVRTERRSPCECRPPRCRWTLKSWRSCKPRFSLCRGARPPRARCGLSLLCPRRALPPRARQHARASAPCPWARTQGPAGLDRTLTARAHAAPLRAVLAPALRALQVRTGGKGTVRRKKKAVHKTASTDDKRLQVCATRMTHYIYIYTIRAPTLSPGAQLFVPARSGFPAQRQLSQVEMSCPVRGLRLCKRGK